MYMHARFQDRIGSNFGVPVNIPAHGESFDAANDCHVSDDGKKIVFRQHGFSTRQGLIVSDMGGMKPAMMEALFVWERLVNGTAAYLDMHGGDDPTESAGAPEFG